MSKGKINYGRNSAANEGKRKTLDELEDLGRKNNEEKGIFDAVTEDISEDFLSYINGLVRAAKTPIKEHTSKEKIGQPKVLVNDIENLKGEELKIQKRSPIRTKRELDSDPVYERINSKKEESRPKFFSNYQPVSQKHEGGKQITGSESATQIIRQLEARRSREREKTVPSLPLKERLNTLTSMADKEEVSSRTFIDCIGEYINQLQSAQPTRHSKIDELAADNKRLRKRLAQYEQKFKEIQVTIQQHLDHLKNREKQYKSKIKQLNRALGQAVDKANEQKDEIDHLQGLLINFTHQVKAYKHTRINKDRLTHLLVVKRVNQKDDQMELGRYDEAFTKTLHSDDLMRQFATTELMRQDPSQSSELDQNESSHQRLGKMMKTNSFLPVTRTKPSRTLTTHVDASKSRSKQPRNASGNHFRKHGETTYISKVCRFDESETDE